MPPPPHLRITFSGTLGTAATPSEIFAFGLSASGPIGGGWLDKAPAEQAALANTLRARYGPLASLVDTAVKLTRVRVASIGLDGRTMRKADGAYSHGDSLTPQNGLGTAGFNPWQTALVVSLRSAYPGPLGRGRFYLPVPDATVQPADGLITEAVRDSIATTMQTFVAGLNTDLAAFSPGLAISVISGGSVTKGIPGQASKVTAVGVGKRLDVMRSRANNISEVMEFLPIA
jgi:hypothetical protein